MLWVGWLAYWLITAAAVKANVSTDSWQSRLAYSAPLWLAGVLLLAPHPAPPLGARFLPVNAWVADVGVLMTAAGLGFAAWARAALGENWSAQITVKQNHVLVTRGPYAIVRHPIYTGGSLALLGTAIVIGEWRALVAWMIATGSFWYKLAIEERVMMETFGDAYVTYAREVAAFIPFVL